MFVFETLGIEITIEAYHGCQQTDSNPGVEIIIESKYPNFSSGSFRLRAADVFPTKGKTMSELYYFSSYRTQDIEQAKAINTLIHLYEIVEENSNKEEKNLLQQLRKHIEKSLIQAFGCDDENNTATKPLALIIPGKRIEESTFDLIDVRGYPKQQDGERKEENDVDAQPNKSIPLTENANLSLNYGHFDFFSPGKLNIPTQPNSSSSEFASSQKGDRYTTKKLKKPRRV